jgi:hypothetical protein
LSSRTRGEVTFSAYITGDTASIWPLLHLDAAASLAQMAARGATGDPKLAALARDRQDLVEEWPTPARALGPTPAKRILG